MKEKNLNKAQIILQNLLKEERRKKDRSQKDLAKITGLTQSAISKYESGERQVNVIELLVICHALDINLSDFIIEMEKRLKEVCKL